MSLWQLDGEAATQAFAQALAATAPTPAVVHLQGDLGAGKSTLARAWLRVLGVTGTVRSPTYTLVERYPVAGGEALHLDLYRIGDIGELEFLGLDDVAARLWLIEWPERGADALPKPDLRVALALSGEGRSARLDALSDAGLRWRARVAAAVRLPTVAEPKP
ncbi:tRNA (adenosine(37)-N6)-threonylcarbamoyltransferase complex ATPase subunit type 1 TsaE [Luteimonas sp. gir]|uniref:tRNA (adenosine(37)-N6)-threonylcarbamoyltransferase complex ATPase subunit type 1 TsaE n=1 Tax=Luteimonas sp. gir TaxID=3127960 RepID=UPI003075BB86